MKDDTVQSIRPAPDITIRPFKVTVYVDLIVEEGGKFHSSLQTKDPAVIMEKDLDTKTLKGVVEDAIRVAREKMGQ